VFPGLQTGYKRGVTDVLTRLRDPEGPLPALIDLVVLDLLGRTLGEVVDPARIAEMIASAVRDWLGSERGEARLVAAWSELVDRIQSEERTLRELVPDEVRDAAERLAAQPYQPDRDALLALLDREPVRKLLREILQSTLVDFGKRVTAPVGASKGGRGLGGALGGLGARAKQRAGVFGALAEEAIGAVGGELERRVEGKAAEFADTAMSGVLGRIVSLLSDPSRADDQAALREALLQGTWDWTGAMAATELRRGDPAAVAEVLREALAAWTGRDDFQETLGGWLETLLEEQGTLTLRDVLADLDLLESVTVGVTELMLERARDFVATGPFAEWWADLERRG